MKRKDTDYLYSTTRIRAMERNLLNSERIGRMLDAKTFEDAARVLSEIGYSELSKPTLESVENALSKERGDTIKTLRSFVKDSRIIDIFCIGFDYHNIKTLIKGAAREADDRHILSDDGYISVSDIKNAILEAELRGLNRIMRDAIGEAREVLARTSDPQLSDFILDRAYFSQMLDFAAEIESEFIDGYVRLMIDVYNLRAWVRAVRQKKRFEFIKNALITGGEIDANRLMLSGSANSDIKEIYSGTKLAEAAEAGELAASGEVGLSDFERLCDNALIEYTKSAKFVAFGEAPIAAYIAAKEADITTVRIIMAGKLEGLTADEIRKRLRIQYV